MINNKVLIRRWLKALQSGNIESLILLQSKDCTWNFPGSKKLPWAGKWVGIERHKKFLGRVGDSVDFSKGGIEFNEFIVDGARISVLGHEIARSMSKKRRWNVGFVWVFTVKRGKIVSLEAYEDTEAIAACY
jgi:ketosteroid isomerase-like protein